MSHASAVEGRTGGNSLIGRLKAGVTIAQAQAEFEALTGRLAESDPRRFQGFGVRVESLTRAGARMIDGIGQPNGDYASSLTILQGAVALVLLISCATSPAFCSRVVPTGARNWRCE